MKYKDQIFLLAMFTFLATHSNPRYKEIITGGVSKTIETGTPAEQEAKDEKKAEKILQQTIGKEGLLPTAVAHRKLIAQSLMSGGLYALNESYNHLGILVENSEEILRLISLRDKAFDSLNDNRQENNYIMALVSAYQEVSDENFDQFKLNALGALKAIPGNAAKGFAGELGAQLLCKNAYKQIVCRHLIYSLSDSIHCKDKHELNNHLCSILPPTVARGVTVEATSKALTDYLFDQLEKRGYDPFKLPPYQRGKNDVWYLINPLLKETSKMVVNCVLACYIVSPAYDQLTSSKEGGKAKFCLDLGEF